MQSCSVYIFYTQFLNCGGINTLIFIIPTLQNLVPGQTLTCDFSGLITGNFEGFFPWKISGAKCFLTRLDALLIRSNLWNGQPCSSHISISTSHISICLCLEASLFGSFLTRPFLRAPAWDLIMDWREGREKWKHTFLLWSSVFPCLLPFFLLPLWSLGLLFEASLAVSTTVYRS